MAIQSIGVIEPLKQYVDAAGVPYAGGTLTFVQVGTSVAQNVYSDSALTVSLGNVVTLNAAGRTSTSASGPATPVYVQQLTYDYTLKDVNGVTIWGPITFSGSQWPGQVQGQAVLNPAANANGYANRFTTTINKASSGTHALFAGTRFDIPTIGAGASTLTEASTVYIEGAPATGTNKYALHVVGDVKVDGNFSTNSYQRCVAFNNTTQSLGDNALTVINLNSEDLDVGTMHDNVTNNSRITVPTGGDGFYGFTARVWFAVNGGATGIFKAQVRKNGATALEENLALYVVATGSPQSVMVSGYANFVATDYIELMGAQVTGAPLNSGSATRSQSNMLSMVRFV